MIECIKSGFIQDEVEKSCQNKTEDLGQRKMVMIGTNQYPNLKEQMLDQIMVKEDPASAAEESKYRKLKLTRGSKEFERIRLNTEKHVRDGYKQPSVFLLTIGNPSMRKARATFATNFFGCGGFNIIDNTGFETSEKGVESALKSLADIVVICSSDEEYVTLVPEISNRIKERNPGILLVVAGYPKAWVDAFKTAGVDEFIHVRSNVTETLGEFQKLLGISH
jgi:methylmalonyl-CoA mutase